MALFLDNTATKAIYLTVTEPALFLVPKYKEAVKNLLVQNWEQELFFPCFSVVSFLESGNFYLTMVSIYISWS